MKKHSETDTVFEFELGCATITCDRKHDYYMALPIRLIGAPRPRFSRSGHTYSDSSYEKFKKNMRLVARSQKWPIKPVLYRGKWRESMEDGWLVLCHAYYSDDRPPDADNALKTIMDSWWVQDKHVRGAVEIHTKQERGDGFEIWLWKLKEAK